MASQCHTEVLVLFFLLCAEINVFVYREMQETGTRRSLSAAFVTFCLMIHLSISYLISQFINFKGFSYEQVQWPWDKKALVFHKEQENRFMWCCSQLVLILKCRYVWEERKPIQETPSAPTLWHLKRWYTCLLAKRPDVSIFIHFHNKVVFSHR